MSKCWYCEKEIKTGDKVEIMHKDCFNKIADLEAKLAEHNEYFEAFNCKDFNEFQDFISTFMLTPHEEQTLIQELKQQLAENERKLEELKEITNSVRVPRRF